MKALVVLLVLAATLAQVSRARLEGWPLAAPASLHEALPSVRALEVMALGYRSLVADYYWMRALSHFGDQAMHPKLYPDLAAFLERVLALDPYFATGYFFAGTALTIKGMDPQPSIRLLERGLRYRPDDWHIAFLLGFNAYYFAGDYALGARALAIAARLPGAPPIAKPLAMRLAAAAGEPEIGLSLLESIVPSLTDEQLKEEYEERRRLLELELQLKHLNKASARYQARHGKPPATIGDLVGPGLLQSIPDEPLGGRYSLSSSGMVTTSNDAKRLRLTQKTPVEAKP